VHLSHAKEEAMTMSLPEILILLVIAAVCGALGKAIAGAVRGGLIVSIVLGFIGALLGPLGLRCNSSSQSPS
jgi:uncharacterized membrane protein YeaQ/YmgE (transglycosylase-associated protein family)